MKRALPILAIAAAVKIVSVLNEKLTALSKKYDAAMAAIIKHNNAMQDITVKFRDFRDHVGLTSDQLVQMTKDFHQIEDRGARFKAIMEAIQEGKYGEKLASQFLEWQEAQKKVEKGTEDLKGKVTDLTKEISK